MKIRSLTRAATTLLVVVAALGVSVSPASASDCLVIDPWEHIGTRMCGTYAAPGDWNDDSVVDEYFIITPDRKIYHSWPASTWVQMPGNGRADDATRAWHDGALKVVKVYVNNVGYYCSNNSGSGWGAWHLCA
jgi:hypothetical protein